MEEQISKQVIEGEIGERFCQNCETAIHGLYCGHCGQEQITKTETFADLARAFLRRRKKDVAIFFFTTQELLVRPGKLIDEFLAGKRSKYYHPINYFMLVAALLTFISLNVGGYTTDMPDLGIEEPEVGSEAQMMQNDLMDKFVKNQNYVHLATLPFYALVSLWFFGKRRPGLGHHFLMMTYVVAMVLLVMAILALFMESGDLTGPHTIISSVFLFGYFAWVFFDLYKIAVWRSILASMGLYLLAFLLFLLFSIFILGPIFYLVGYVMGRI